MDPPAWKSSFGEPAGAPPSPPPELSPSERHGSTTVAPADPASKGVGINATGKTAAHRPSSLRSALQAANATTRIAGTGPPSDSASEEDYDTQSHTRATILLRRRAKAALASDGPDITLVDTAASSASATRPSLGPVVVGKGSSSNSSSSFEELHLEALPRGLGINGAGANALAVDDKEFRDMLRRGLQRAKDSRPGSKKKRSKFGDLVFTRQFSAFDRQNEEAARSPFHGFYTLFWLAITLFMLKIAANNWRAYGSILGNNEIMGIMFRRDVIVMLLADGVMCGLTGFGWLLQLAVLRNWVDWDKSGWIIQNLWQTFFIASVIGLTLWRDWPWTHTVYFVLHGIAMLMKQHSYAFYNGYLSTLYKQRAHLLVTLKKLETISPILSPSSAGPPVASLSTEHLRFPPSAAEMKERRQSMTAAAAVTGDSTTDLDRIAAAIESGEPLDMEQVHVFERILKWEVDGLSDELQDKATTPARAYPHNLTMANHYEYIVLPTLVYELEYPRNDSIDWSYVAEKAVATFGLIFVMISLSQAFIYPIVMQTVAMKEEGVPLGERFRQFPWILADLMFPFMMEYLLTWYLIWETILNILGELTMFADRSFYDAWWNSVSWDQFARDWNRPVHNFLLRHVYHSSISSMKVNKYQATLITFFLSACVHELVMWCIFKKLRGYLLFLQMCQLPLVRLSRTRWLKDRKTIGNLFFWLGIFTGPSLLCSLYLIL